MRLYTRTGDQGETHLLDGTRVMKDHTWVEAHGTIDELNAFLGYAIQSIEDQEVKLILLQIQDQLFDLGTDLGRIESEEPEQKKMITHSSVLQLEKWIDRFEQECPPIKRFILPGGTKASSVLHVCRAVCRRAERRVVTLNEQHPINVEALRYLNRLSDLLFVLARLINVRANVMDLEYHND